MDGKHSMRLQNVNVYVWTGPKCLAVIAALSCACNCIKGSLSPIVLTLATALFTLFCWAICKTWSVE